jgi:hypothetical protein
MESLAKEKYGLPSKGNYEKMLKYPEWIERKSEVIILFKQACDLCNSTTNGIELHHKYYVSDRYPWEYPENAFMVLCKSCHLAYHKLKEVPFYKEIEKKYLSGKDFSDIKIQKDYDLGYILSFTDKIRGRVEKVKLDDYLSIWIASENKTLFQIINGLNSKSVKLPEHPGRIYSKIFSSEHIEYYIDGWTKKDILSIQTIYSKNDC